MDKKLIKVLKRLFMLGTHFVATIIIQLILLMILAFPTRVAWYFQFSAICLILLFVDYVINGIILRTTNGEIKNKRLFHLLDLVLFATTNLWIVLSDFIQHYVIMLSGIDIVEHVIVLVLDTLLVVERIVLIRKT